MWFQHEIPISIFELMQLILWPSICLLSKLRSIFQEIIRSRTYKLKMIEQERFANCINRMKSKSNSERVIIMKKNHLNQDY